VLVDARDTCRTKTVSSKTLQEQDNTPQDQDNEETIWRQDCVKSLRITLVTDT